MAYHPNLDVINRVREAAPPPRKPAVKKIEFAVARNLGLKVSRIIPEAAGPVHAKHPNRTLNAQKANNEDVDP